VKCEIFNWQAAEPERSVDPLAEPARLMEKIEEFETKAMTCSLL
jgi:hypothetical protein